jgi:cobalt-zinc-cadmium efflux system membrane fusion protein
VRAIPVAVGDHVAAGAVVAVVESDDSLQRYAVPAPLAGVVAERGMNPGEHSGDQPLVTIVDLSHVWVEVPLFARDAAAVHAGMTATVSVDGRDQASAGAVTYVSPIGSPDSQTTTARIVLANDGQWIPGMVVSVRVRTRELQAAVTVPRVAIQRHEAKTVVFVKSGDGFRMRPVQLGIDDGVTVEIRDGLKTGESVATSNSYVVLAELEKGNLPSDD